ncbi:MAG: hypothetical protein ACLQBY_05580 [Solirubrobacteraceae bacterium]
MGPRHHPQAGGTAHGLWAPARRGLTRVFVPREAVGDGGVISDDAVRAQIAQVVRTFVDQVAAGTG